MKWDTVFFDLDGTVTDSAPGIFNAVRFALKNFLGRDEHWTDKDLNMFIGPPLIDSFQKFIPCSHDDADKCLAWYREYYRPTGIFENAVYPGIEELLIALRERGVKIVLATAKPEEFARQILDYFKITQYFDAIHGATMEESRNKKDQVIAWALKHSGELGRVIMLGDRENDVSGAKVNGLECVGALWGYGTEEELLTAGAIALCRLPADFLKFFEG